MGAVMSDRTGIIRVLVADDHPMMRDGIAYALEKAHDMTVVGSAADGGEAVTQFTALRPDVVVMDLQMPNLDGLEAIAQIRSMQPDACIVVLTTYAGDARVGRAMALGAASYVLKTVPAKDIVAAIRAAHEGHMLLAPDVAQDLELHRATEPLTVRELSVLRLIASGKHNRSIGEELNVSEQTIKSRIKNILAKLNARDRAHAVVLAMKRGFMNH